MKNGIRKSVAAAALGSSLLFASAIPAQAAPRAEVCPILMPIYVNEVWSCLCGKAADVVVMTTGKTLYCAVN